MAERACLRAWRALSALPRLTGLRPCAVCRRASYVCCDRGQVHALHHDSSPAHAPATRLRRRSLCRAPRPSGAARLRFSPLSPPHALSPFSPLLSLPGTSRASCCWHMTWGMRAGLGEGGVQRRCGPRGGGLCDGVPKLALAPRRRIAPPSFRLRRVVGVLALTLVKLPVALT